MNRLFSSPIFGSSIVKKKASTPLFASNGIYGAANAILEAKKIVFCVGAGISQQYLPDFRTKDVGLYDQLRYSDKFKQYEGCEILQELPEELFTPQFIHRYPKLFFAVCEEMKLWPSSRPAIPPTDFHKFMRELSYSAVDHKSESPKNVLKIITQNVDGLEKKSGIDPSLVIEAHGTFSEAKCMNAHEPHLAPPESVRDVAKTGAIPRCKECNEILRPSVVLFGDPLPDRFQNEAQQAAEAADLLIIAGTSLNVFPVAAIPDQVREDCPRILMNRGTSREVAEHFDFGGRDLLLDGDCQEEARKLMDIIFNKKHGIRH